jgi:hypothetical protein
MKKAGMASDIRAHPHLHQSIPCQSLALKAKDKYKLLLYDQE